MAIDFFGEIEGLIYFFCRLIYTEIYTELI